jgi:hypothetical protein
MNRQYKVELDTPPNARYKWVKITNIRTGKAERFYEPEFVYGQIHYHPATRLYPNYIHAEVMRLCK